MNKLGLIGQSEVSLLSILAIFLLVGAAPPLDFGDVLDNVSSVAAAPTLQPREVAQGVLATMTPDTRATPTRSSTPPPGSSAPGSLSGFGKLAGAVGLAVLVLFAFAVVVLLVLKALGVAQIHVERQQQAIEDHQLWQNDVKQQQRDRDAEGLNRWNLYSRKHKEDLELDLDQLGEDTGAILGANARLLVDLAIDQLEGNANVRALRRAAYANRGVSYHYTETVLRKMRWRADNGWPILVVKGREPSQWVLTLRDQPQIPGYARRRTWAFEPLPPGSEEDIIRYEKRKPKRFYL